MSRDTWVGLGIIASCIAILVALFYKDDDYLCQEAYFQMQSVLRCMDNYPMCTTTAQDFEDSRWNVDYYDRNCYEYEQRRPKPPAQKKPEKPKLES